MTDPLKVNALFRAVLSSVTIDPGLKSQLIALASRYGALNTSTIPETALPVTQVTGPGGAGYQYAGADIGDVEFPDEPTDRNVIEAWDPGALPAGVKPGAVGVYNIVGSATLAAQTGAALTADGFHVTTETDGQVPAAQSETLVQYRPGQQAEGMAVFDELRGAVMLQSDAAVPPGVVDVQAGSVLAVTSHAPNAATGLPATTIPTPGGQTSSSAVDRVPAYDPRPC